MLNEPASEILVVAGTPAHLKLLKELLTAHGYRVRPVATGELALRSAAVQCPDLVLLDIHLPDLNGFEVCRRLKASGPAFDAPVIFISALHDAVEKLQGFAAGGVDYITQPFAAEEVLARIHTHLELRRLRSDLEAANRDMEARVRERTRELAAANQALSKSETFLSSIIAQNPLPIVIFDATGKIVRFNRATRHLFQPTDGRVLDGKAILQQYNLFQDRQIREQGYLPVLERVFHRGETIRVHHRYDPTRLQGELSPDPSHRLDLDSTIFPVKDASGCITHAVVYHLDITDLKAAEVRLRYHLDLEQAVAEVSTLMSKPDWDDLDVRIHWALERIGRLARADRSYLFTRTPEGQRLSGLYEWCAPGIHSQIQELKNLSIADYGVFQDLLQKHEVVEIQTAQLPDDTVFKPILLKGDVRSLICVPVRWSGNLRGFLGFDAVTAARTWSEEEARLLHLVAELIAHTLQHIESDRALRESTRFLESLDRISHILTRREKDVDLLANLAAALLEMFQTDRVFFIHPCAPDAVRFRVIMETARPKYPGAFAAGDEVILDDEFRSIFRQALRRAGPVLSEFAGGIASKVARRSGVQSQMVIALYPQADQPWLLGLQQCAHARRWSDVEQRLFQAIAERISDALSGYLLLQQLQESEERFAKTFHANPALMCITDIATGRFLDANARLLDQLEYTREQLIGRTSVELDFYADPGARERMIEQLRQDGFVRELPIRFRTRTGKIIETLYSAEILHLGDRNVLLSLVYDITDRQRAEEALRQSEERFAKAFQASPAPMLITTLDEGRIIDVNARGLSLVGATREELIGHTTRKTGIWIDPGARDRMIAQLRKIRSFKDIPLVLRTRGGELREILWSAELITLGNQSALLSLAYDLTEQRRAEQALQASERRYRTIFETAAVSIREEDMSVVKAALDALKAQGISDIRAYLTQHPALVADCAQQVQVVDVNQQTLKLFGASGKAELLGGLNRILLPESLPAFTEILIAIAEGKRYFEVETVHQTLQGERRNALLTAAFPEPDAPFTSVLMSMIDITERKRAEEELQRHREHLEDLVAERTAELRQAMSQLVQAEKLAALGNLVAGVAHELNTPLGNTRVVASTLGEELRVFAAAVESGSLRRSQVEAFLNRGREAVELLERNTARAADLIGHFKQVAVDQTSMRRRRFHLRQTVEELLVTLQPQFKRTAHCIELEIPSNFELDSYPGPLEQVLANLVNNSLIHGFAGIETGTIRMSATLRDADHIHINYRDDGVGIAEALHSRIFDPFFTTRLGQGGSGLGLYIVYNLVTGVLGGTVQVESSPGQGVAFILILPTVAPVPPTADSRRA